MGRLSDALQRATDAVSRAVDEAIQNVEDTVARVRRRRMRGEQQQQEQQQRPPAPPPPPPPADSIEKEYYAAEVEVDEPEPIEGPEPIEPIEAPEPIEPIEGPEPIDDPEPEGMAIGDILEQKAELAREQQQQASEPEPEPEPDDDDFIASAVAGAFRAGRRLQEEKRMRDSMQEVDQVDQDAVEKEYSDAEREYRGVDRETGEIVYRLPDQLERAIEEGSAHRAIEAVGELREEWADALWEAGREEDALTLLAMIEDWDTSGAYEITAALFDYDADMIDRIMKKRGWDYETAQAMLEKYGDPEAMPLWHELIAYEATRDADMMLLSAPRGDFRLWFATLEEAINYVDQVAGGRQFFALLGDDEHGYDLYDVYEHI